MGENQLRKKHIRLLALATVLTLAACGSDDNSDTSGDITAAPGATSSEPGAPSGTEAPGTTAGDAPTTSVSTDSTEPPVDLDPNGSLVHADDAGPSAGFDPHASRLYGDPLYLAPVYDRLIRTDANGARIPGLATAWEFSDDGLTFELTLREGVTFHDGTPFTAEAVKASLDRAKAAAPGSKTANLMASVTEITAVDATTVRLTLSKPDELVVKAMTDVPGMIIAPASLAAPESLATTAIGAGPFRVVSYEPGVRVVYERYDDYFERGKVTIADLEIKVMGDYGARLRALQAGEIDTAQLDPSQTDEIASSGLNLETGAGLRVDQILLNRTRSEFGNVSVRQALNFAIDRDALVEGIYFGHATASVQPYPANAALGHSPEADDIYEYSPDRARQLLAEAGLADGFSFTMMVPSSFPASVSEAEAIRAQLAEVNIDVEIRLIDASEVVSLFFQGQEADAILGPFPLDPDPIYSANSFFNPTSVTNPGGHTIPEWEELLATARDTVDDDEIRAAAEAFWRSTVEQAGNVIIAQLNQAWTSAEDVVGFTSRLDGLEDFTTVGIAA